MNSELAKRMDNVGFAFDSTNVTDDLKELENQYGASKYGTIKFTREELYWIGYLYRYWAYVSDKSSKQVYKLVKPEQLKSLYFPYHSLDPLQAIERILEATSLEPQNQLDDIARGVSILRKVRSRTKAPRFTDQ